MGTEAETWLTRLSTEQNDPLFQPMGLICPTATNVNYVSLTIPERVGMLECSELALWPDAD